MDNAQYREEFVSEAQVNLDTLNECLLALEKEPSDMDNINKILRAFHTLKGNSAMMDFMEFSELAHSLEDVLAKIRDKKLKVTSEVMDLIFEGCDILQDALDGISKGKPDNIHAKGMNNELKKFLENKEDENKDDKKK